MDDALAVLDDLDVSQAALFGISEGGSAATMLAAAHPDRESAMVQYGTYARLAQADDHPDDIPADRLKKFWGRIAEDWVDPSSIDHWAPSRAGDPELHDWEELPVSRPKARSCPLSCRPAPASRRWRKRSAQPRVRRKSHKA